MLCLRKRGVCWSLLSLTYILCWLYLGNFVLPRKKKSQIFWERSMVDTQKEPPLCCTTSKIITNSSIFSFKKTWCYCTYISWLLIPLGFAAPTKPVSENATQPWMPFTIPDIFQDDSCQYFLTSMLTPLNEQCRNPLGKTAQFFTGSPATAAPKGGGRR